MAGVDSSSQIHVEDFSQELIMADMRKTVVTTRMRKGEALENMEYSWPVEKMAQRRKGGVPEGKDVGEFEGTPPQKKLWNRAEKWWRTPHISKEQQVVYKEKTGAKYDKLVAKFIKEEKRDIEWETLSDQDSNEDNGRIGSRMKGLGAVINAGEVAQADTRMAIPAEYMTPAAQVFTDALAELNDQTLADMLQARATRVGESGEFTLFCAPKLKRYLSDNIGYYVRNKDGFTVVARTATNAAIDNGKYRMHAIDVIESEFGTFNVEWTPFMPTTLRGYGLDFEQLMLRPLAGEFCTHEELEDQGGGRRGIVETILGYEYGDPRAHFKIAPSDEVVLLSPDNDSEEENP